MRIALPTAISFTLVLAGSCSFAPMTKYDREAVERRIAVLETRFDSLADELKRDKVEEKDAAAMRDVATAERLEALRKAFQENTRVTAEALGFAIQTVTPGPAPYLLSPTPPPPVRQ